MKPKIANKRNVQVQQQPQQQQLESAATAPTSSTPRLLLHYDLTVNNVNVLVPASAHRQSALRLKLGHVKLGNQFGVARANSTDANDDAVRERALVTVTDLRVDALLPDRSVSQSTQQQPARALLRRDALLKEVRVHVTYTAIKRRTGAPLEPHAPQHVAIAVSPLDFHIDADVTDLLSDIIEYNLAYLPAAPVFDVNAQHPSLPDNKQEVKICLFLCCYLLLLLLWCICNNNA